MQSVGPQNPYEVYCYQCHVTAPVGLRRCVHCGGRLSSQQKQPGAMARLPLDESVEEDETLAGLPQRLGTNLPRAAVWILLLIGGSLYRLCN